MIKGRALICESASPSPLVSRVKRELVSRTSDAATGVPAVEGVSARDKGSGRRRNRVSQTKIPRLRPPIVCSYSRGIHWIEGKSTSLRRRGESV